MTGNGSNKPARQRSPAEFFGLEKMLWEDREQGVIAQHYHAELEKAAQALQAQSPSQGFARDDSVEAQLIAAIRTAQRVLLAAHGAMKDFSR